MNAHGSAILGGKIRDQNITADVFEVTLHFFEKRDDNPVCI
jgi:hypothetical protein